MQDVIQLGPFVLKTSMLIMIVSTVIGFLALKLRLKKSEYVKKITVDPFVNAVIIMVVTWKLSIVLFEPSLIFAHPLSLLYFSGGERGIFIAVILSVIYLWWRSRKDKLPISPYADLVLTAFLSGISVYYMLYLVLQPMNIYADAAYVVLYVLLYIWLTRKSFAHAILLMQLLLWYSLGSLAISFLQMHQLHYLFGFSKIQLIYIILAVISIGASLRYNQQDQQEKEE